MRSHFTVLVVFLISLFFVLPAFSQTEDELVAKFFKKSDRIKIKKTGYFVFHGSYGKLNTESDYNSFTKHVSPLMSTAAGGQAGIGGIYRSKELYGGFGMVTSPKSSMQIGITYWLKLGSNTNGDYNLTSLNLGDTQSRTDFNLQSQIQVYGFSGEVDYYLYNAPDSDGKLTNFSIKAGGGGGMYFAKWNIWDGYSGYNIHTSTASEISGDLSGMAPGFTASVSAEYPIPMGELVFEGSLKYLYLNFTNMKWYNNNNEEHVATYNLNSDRVELNMSGPRAHFGLKRYFSL